MDDVINDEKLWDLTQWNHRHYWQYSLNRLNTTNLWRGR